MFYKDYDQHEGVYWPQQSIILQPAYLYDNYCLSIKAQLYLTQISNLLNNHHVVHIKQSWLRPTHCAQHIAPGALKWCLSPHYILPTVGDKINCWWCSTCSNFCNIIWDTLYTQNHWKLDLTPCLFLSTRSSHHLDISYIQAHIFFKVISSHIYIIKFTSIILLLYKLYNKLLFYSHQLKDTNRTT